MQLCVSGIGKQQGEQEGAMYCILVTGIPAAGKSTIAGRLGERLSLPVISKDKIKELFFDSLGFHSREEKVKLGVTAMEVMYYFAESLMKSGQPFILENNFEDISREGIVSLLESYAYQAITVVLTGNFEKIYQRFLKRNESPDRHPGHVVNDCYPLITGGKPLQAKNRVPSYEDFVAGIRSRGMDRFEAGGPQIVVDTTDFSLVDEEALAMKIRSMLL